MNPKNFLPVLLLAGLTACSSARSGEETQVLIETDKGDIVVKLYNETPKHRDNFIKLVKSGFYEDLLFHRVIQDFMIQGGDPNSRDAQPGAMLGSGDTGTLIDAEFRFPQLFHKRGVLAAAREGDDVNPEKKSSGCQFYLVTGKVFSDQDLNEIERSRRETAIQGEVNKLVKSNAKQFSEIERSNDMMRLQVYMDSLRNEATRIYEANGNPFVFTDEVREIYKTKGGTPWLDNNYTVFGEVVEGMDVVDKIQQVRTNRQNRPEEDIKMKMKILK